MADQEDRTPLQSIHAIQAELASERRSRVKELSDLTLKAFEEMEVIASWAELVAICEEQKRKRGW